MVSQRTSSGPQDEDLFAVAARWWTAQESAGWSAADAVRLDDWLAADPAHAEAYVAVTQAMSAFDGVEDDVLLASLRQAAIQAAPEPRPKREGLNRRAWMLGGGAIAAGLAAVAVVGRGPATEVYESPAQGRRAVTLADGSRLALDAGTRVEVRFSKDARSLRLVRGQARFDVAHDRTRPFSVAVGGHVVVATGTAFNIDSLGDRAVVTLLEGRVLVRPLAGGAATPMSPGQQLVVQPKGELQVSTLADAATATAWQDGRVVFQNARLADAVARINRYGGPRILCQGPAVADLRLTGLFEVRDRRGFIEAVTAYLPVAAETHPNGEVVLSAKPAPGGM